MNNRTTFATWISAAAVALACAPSVFAQDNPAASTTVLKGQAVTESNLVDALLPDDSPVVTRSLRVQRDNPVKPGAAPEKPRKASASLLITFETNSAALMPQAKKQLDVVAAALRNDKLSEYNFNVEGHADPRGTRDANLSLSQQRAESVRAYLVSQNNIDPKRLKAVGKGDAELLNKANPQAHENRRVTIVTDVQSQ